LEYIIIIGLFGGLGIAAGTFFNLWIQGGMFIAFILLMNSKSTSGLEGIFPMIIGTIFFAGVTVGNISYAVQTEEYKTLDVYNPFVVEKEVEKEVKKEDIDNGSVKDFKNHFIIDKKTLNKTEAEYILQIKQLKEENKRLLLQKELDKKDLEIEKLKQELENRK